MAKANYGLYGSRGFFLLFILIALVSLTFAVFFSYLRVVFIFISVLAVVLLFAVPAIFVRNREGGVPQILSAGKISTGCFVLDVGTGRGFPAIEIAKAVPGCRVIGIDVWDQPAEGQVHKGFLVGNTKENAERNAMIEGVQDRVEFRQLDARKMPFGSETFDAVVSFSAIHQMVYFGPGGERVLGEIYRVLKRGGRFVDVDVLTGTRMVELIRDIGFTEIALENYRLLGILKILSATKV